MLRILKKMFSMKETVDFGESFGGLLTTRGRVSKIEVRDGTMKLPVSVTSQYRRFCLLLVGTIRIYRETYLFVSDNHSLAISYIYTIG